MLYIRTDGNRQIGTGHVMRCLAIADAARKQKTPVTFVVADAEMEPLLRERGFPCLCLHSVWNDLEREMEQMEALIRERQVTRLLVDSYYATKRYLSRLKQQTRIAYLDDLNLHPCPCHLLINYNIYAAQWDYPRRYPDAELLLGSRYAPLREEFQGLAKLAARPAVEQVLVTTGGSDPHNVAGRLAAAVNDGQLRGITFHIVAGRFNAHLPQLRTLCRFHENLCLHENVERMSDLMLDCDLAVSAGGTTLYELCACGLPTILFVMADNQQDAARAFDGRGMLYSGDVREGPAACVDRICQGIRALRGDREKRASMGRILQDLVDGEGAARIAGRLAAL